MKKSVTVILSVIVLFFSSCEGTPKKEVNVVGDWKFEQFVEGTEKLSPQANAMVEAILSIFKDCKVSYNEDGTVSMTSPVVGSKTGTYTVADGKLDQQMGKGTQFILNVKNDKEKLVILLNEEDTPTSGKILLVLAK